MQNLKAAEKFCKTVLKDLVNIRSVSGEEERLIVYLEKLFSELGLKARRIPPKLKPSNLLVSIGQGEPVICLNAHADTVPPAGKSKPRARLVKNRLYGLGSSDDKGPLVAAICAIKNSGIDKGHLKGRVDLLVSIGEERGGEGTELAIRSGYRCGGAVVCESTGLDIAIAQSGVYFIDLKTKGIACHGSKPWQGKNAILEMMDLVAQIKKVVETRKHFPLTGQPSLNLGAIQAGDIPNRVPDSCSARLDMRLMPGENMASFKKAIAKIFKKKRWRSASYIVTQDREPMLTDKKNTVVRALSRATRCVLGYSPRCLGIRGWTEAGNFSHFLNVPAIIFGPGSMGRAHSADEWIELEEVYQAARIYELFIKEMLDGNL